MSSPRFQRPASSRPTNSRPLPPPPMSIALTTLATLTTFRRLRTDEREKNPRTGEAKNGISNIKCPYKRQGQAKSSNTCNLLRQEIIPSQCWGCLLLPRIEIEALTLSLPFSKAQTSSFSFYVYVSLSLSLAWSLSNSLSLSLTHAHIL